MSCWKLNVSKNTNLILSNVFFLNLSFKLRDDVLNIVFESIDNQIYVLLC